MVTNDPIKVPIKAPIIEAIYTKYDKNDAGLFFSIMYIKINNIVKNVIIASREAYIAFLFDVIFHAIKLIIPRGTKRYKK
ncbi:hypothetical protein BN3087_350002 [Sulfurovum sp. enrichment culture clone C5]|uniref:Uncharacterized protein n=1 Tax=Sulfurovum sp. enrichment culture clone C5 TaxID=497650 RepID=A0A0S4XMC3_9BACT|nr:hypothetical protein BN3087_350002 [Sulfurovum sp. enrichment culture clone C5]